MGPCCKPPQLESGAGGPHRGPGSFREQGLKLLCSSLLGMYNVISSSYSLAGIWQAALVPASSTTPSRQ